MNNALVPKFICILLKILGPIRGHHKKCINKSVGLTYSRTGTKKMNHRWNERKITNLSDIDGYINKIFFTVMEQTNWKFRDRLMRFVADCLVAVWTSQLFSAIIWWNSHFLPISFVEILDFSLRSIWQNLRFFKWLFDEFHDFFLQQIVESHYIFGDRLAKIPIFLRDRWQSRFFFLGSNVQIHDIFPQPIDENRGCYRDLLKKFAICFLGVLKKFALCFLNIFKKFSIFFQNLLKKFAIRFCELLTRFATLFSRDSVMGFATSFRDRFTKFTIFSDTDELKSRITVVIQIVDSAMLVRNLVLTRCVARD